MTEPFETRSGVRQGCVLSPLLFNIYMDRIIKEAHINKEKNIANKPDEELTNEINELLFADDQSNIQR